jgi:hypothetical protein
MILNHSEEMRECYQQAVQCAQQADAQIDSKVKKHFLKLSQLWLLLAEGHDLSKAPADLSKP